MYELRGVSVSVGSSESTRKTILITTRDETVWKSYITIIETKIITVLFKCDENVQKELINKLMLFQELQLN